VIDPGEPLLLGRELDFAASCKPLRSAEERLVLRDLIAEAGQLRGCISRSTA
jgi:hypothetical protein